MSMTATARKISRPSEGLSERKARLLEIIKDRSLLTGRTFTLASGGTSTYYLDMKPTTFGAEGLSVVADIVFEMLREQQFDAIGGLELGAVPIINAVSMRSWPERPIEGFVVRKEKKGHGTDKKIDGNFKDGMTVILIDDVTTKGGSVMEAIRAVRERGATVDKVITIVDRLEGAEKNLSAQGITLLPVFTRDDLLG